MEEFTPDGQESTDRKLAEDIAKIRRISLDEGVATCHVCSVPLHEGDSVVVYAYRPAGEGRYKIGHATCSAHDDIPQSEYTLGVRELLVRGRVGCCTDAANQSSWQVLLQPSVVSVSATATTSARRCTNSTESDTDSVAGSAGGPDSDSAEEQLLCSAFATGGVR